MTRRLVFILPLSFSLLFLNCTPKEIAGSGNPNTSSRVANPKNLKDSDLISALPTKDAAKGISITLKEGRPELSGQPATPAAKTTKLSAAQVQKVLDRLPPLKAEDGDVKDFALRERSLPPPRTGKTIKATFPPDEVRGAVVPTAKALEVTRYAPEGEVNLAPHFSVTFNQPMVEITSHKELSHKQVPVKLTPRPDGKWRWVGTKTLLFAAAGERMPQATKYTVEVPLGTKSATGVASTKAQTWSFATPPASVRTMFPTGGPTVREPLMYVAFDQYISPEKVVRMIKVTARGTTFPVRLADAAEIEADDTVSSIHKNTKEGYGFAFKATETLPGDTHVTVTFPPGIPSAEGPRTLQSKQVYGFRTYGPLKLTRHRCGWNKRCRPGDWWTLEFNNPLDDQSYEDSVIVADPAVPGLVHYPSWAQIQMRGATKGRTTYNVTVKGSLRDKFGQTLGEDKTVTFKVGKADPFMQAVGGALISLDPLGGSNLPIYTTNYKALKVRVHKVSPADWPKFLKYMRRKEGYEKGTAVMPGKTVIDQRMRVDAKPDELVETKIDLSKAFNEDGLGHALVFITPVGGKKWEQSIAWIQSTQIGIDAFVDRSELVGWATKLANGAPLEGVELEILPNGVKGTTSADGLATIALPKTRAKTTNVLKATKGDDVAILPENTYWWGSQGGWWSREPGATTRWHVFNDRQMYKPDEEIHIKGWLRTIEARRGGDVKGVPVGTKNVAYKVNDVYGNEVAKGTAKLTGLGGFDFAVKLPKTMNLGWSQIQFNVGKTVLSGYQFSHSFQVQEFRRPEFEVKAKTSEGPFTIGEHAVSTVTAAYYAGGGLPNAQVAWNVYAAPSTFTPPNWDQFTFGTWRPWWQSWYGGSQRNVYKSLSGKTDGQGEHHLRIEFDKIDVPEVTSIRAESTVYDVNRQAWTSKTTMVVHPSDMYIGMKAERLFVNKGESLDMKVVVVDQEGNVHAKRKVAMRMSRLVWKRVKGNWKQVEEEADTKVITSGKKPIDVRFKPEVGGSYKVAAVVADDAGRINRSELTLWVAGGDGPPSRGVARQQVTLIPSQKEYAPGDTAEVLVQAPFADAEGLVTLRRDGIVHTERIKLEGRSYTLEIPIEDKHVPNVYLHVDLVGGAPRGAPLDADANKKLPVRPAFASGNLNLTVSPATTRSLQVTATPKDKGVEPGGKTSVTVEVTKDGKPVSGAEVAIVVVDEAILSLTGYSIPDPMVSFYYARYGHTSDYHQRQSVLLADTTDLEANKDKNEQARMEFKAVGGANGGLRTRSASVPASAAAPMKKSKRRNGAEKPAEPMMDAPMDSLEEDSSHADGDSAGEGSSPIKMRKDFSALVGWFPAENTDASGRVTVPVKVADNLTRYRVTAVAVAGEKTFGKGESSITARLPLMVRPSAPRFLNYGDTFEMPIVIQNQTDDVMTVDVAMRVSNAEITDGAGRRVSVPANDRVEVRIPAAAAMPGRARFQIGGVSGRWADAATIDLPVWTPATTEAFAMYGEIDDGAIAQPVLPPGGVEESFGGLEVTTSSTAVQALTDAVIYLTNYPFECSEQISSRLLAIASLRDVLDAFDAEGLPEPKELLASVERDMERLELMQNSNGGFAFWRRGDDSWPYLSVHVAHSLARARKKKFDVPDKMFKDANTYLKKIDRYIPSWYSEEARLYIKSYALYVRHHMGDKDPREARNIIKRAGGVEKMPLEALGWLIPVMHKDSRSAQQLAALHKHLANRVTETAGAAHFATNYSDGAHVLLHSNRAADAVILEGLVLDRPKSDLIPKIVQGLLAHRVRGRWGSTQENAFVLVALDRYFAVYEKQTPNFVARVWLGDGYAGDHKFKGRTTERHRIDIPMKTVQDGGRRNLVVSKDGPGRLYYRIGMSYAPSDLKLPPAEHGFTVERIYEPVENDDDVYKDKDGTWHIKAGATVRVRLTMVAPTRRYHVALVDPLPAGLEPQNPVLATTGTLPKDAVKDAVKQDAKRRSFWWWYRPWFEHQNMRDERVEAFSTLVWAGVHNYSYIARATTPGNFVVPPPKAEEMYHPETFGRGAGDRVIVEMPKNLESASR